MAAVIERLKQFRGSRVFFNPLGGNNGDRLIEMGSRHILSTIGLLLADNPKSADAIVINGSGGLGVELWDKGLCGIRSCVQEFDDKPVIILPSSYYFEKCDFPGCFAGRSAPAYLFARDLYSLDLIQKQKYPSNVIFGIDHDMAFALADTEFLRSLKSRATNQHVLIVERFDVESVTDVNRQLPIPDNLKHLVPCRVKHSLKKLLHVYRTASTGFTHSTLRRIYDEYPQYAQLPVLAQDISSIAGFTFEEFCEAIADAALVVTTRLHVAILAAMLKKETIIKQGIGPYQKMRGTFQYSMSDMGHVHLW